MTTPLAKKLHLKPGHRLLALNAPAPYAGLLAPLPEGATLHTAAAGRYDVVHLFAEDRSQLERLAPEALASLKPGGLLWISYPKGRSGHQTDLTRDRGWEVIWAAGRECVAQVSVDAQWSAGRFKQAEAIGRKKRP